MAAFDTPLVDQLLTPPRQQRHQRPSPSSSTTASPAMPEAKSTILAQFPPGREPAGTSHIIPDSITNLLDSTPPQIVRALGQAEPLVRGLNTVLAILTWTSGQDWLSFLLLVAWWTICLYGYVIIKFAGNFVPVIIIATLYSLHRTGCFYRPLTLIFSRTHSRTNVNTYFVKRYTKRYRSVEGED